MTTNARPAPPCTCRSTGGVYLLSAKLAELSGNDPARTAGLSCDDVHGLLRQLLDIHQLTGLDGRLIAELDPHTPRFERGSERLAVAVMLATVAAFCGLCGFFTWVLF
jgi:hypothetical protein